MIHFEHIAGDIKLLKVPFGGAWTEIVLIDGRKKILIDSGASGSDIDSVLLPALKNEGYTLGDMDYLLNTHSHGDHIGGFARVKELAPHIKVAAAYIDQQNVEYPDVLAVRTRGKYPELSPAPQSYLTGVKPDLVLNDRELLEDSLMLIETPGHDFGCVCWYELHTSKRSLQATACRGMNSHAGNRLL